MRAVAARGDHQAVETVALDVFLDVSQRFGETGKVQDLSRFHAGELAGLLNECGVVKMLVECLSAGAGKDAHARRLAAYVAFGRKPAGIGQERPFAAGGIRIQAVIEQAHHLSGCAAGIYDRLGDFLRGRERAADKHARPCGLKRGELICFAETMLVQPNAEHFRKLSRRFGGLQAGRQDNHVKAFFVDLSIGFGVAQDQVVR